MLLTSEGSVCSVWARRVSCAATSARAASPSRRRPRRISRMRVCAVMLFRVASICARSEASVIAATTTLEVSVR